MDTKAQLVFWGIKIIHGFLTAWGGGKQKNVEVIFKQPISHTLFILRENLPISLFSLLLDNFNQQDKQFLTHGKSEAEN